MGAIVGIVVGILAGGLVTGFCMFAGHVVLRWVSCRTPTLDAQHHLRPDRSTKRLAWCAQEPAQSRQHVAYLHLEIPFATSAQKAFLFASELTRGKFLGLICSMS